MGAVNTVNIKLMKSGFVEAMDIAAICRATNTELMVGAMIESRLAISAAAHFVAGLGGFRYIDLDTPMLLAEDPFTGGYEQFGGVYDLSGVKAGLGVERKA
jgi:L-alanine-DL-glutamate epimerase-like enolase superfamily enzyme